MTRTNVKTSTPVMRPNAGNRHLGIGLLAAYSLVYASMLFAMYRLGNFDVSEALLVLTIVGVGFSGAAWLLTIGSRPLDCSVLKPRPELTVVLAYLLLLIAFVTWGLEFLRRHVPSDPETLIAIVAAKLLVFVVLPGFIMWAFFGYTWRGLMPISAQGRHLLTILGMSILLLAFQALLGRGLQDIRRAGLPTFTFWYGIPLTFLWLVLETGVVEEFFFRVLLQTRLSAALESELGGIVLMSLIFGLAHAPGLYLRTGLTQEGLPLHPSLLMAVGYSIVITAVAGFFLGVLWARTRNFAVIVVTHAMGDLLPNVLPMLHSLRLLG